MGTLRGIAFRPSDGDPMQEIETCNVLADRGLEVENRPAGKREVTLISDETWKQVCQDLGVDLPWYTRRANLLIADVDLPTTIGKELVVGGVHLKIHGESRPCKLMDEQHQGLRAALGPECRGGVFGKVLLPGTIQVGDPVHVPRE